MHINRDDTGNNNGDGAGDVGTNGNNGKTDQNDSVECGINAPSMAMKNKHRPEYDEGMDVYKAPFRLGESSRSLDGTVLFNLGRLSHNLGSYDDALRLYKRSLLALENGGQPDELLTFAILVGVSQILYAKGDHVFSLKTYMTALSFARNYFGEDSLEVAVCLNCIGVLQYVMPSGDDAIALIALQTSLHLRLELLDRDHIDVGTTWNNVGRVYFQQGKYEDAMNAYKEALRIRRKRQGESVDVAATIFNIGQVHHQLENRKQALSLYQEFLKLSKVHFGEYHRDICIVTTCIGQVSFLVGPCCFVFFFLLSMMLFRTVFLTMSPFNFSVVSFVILFIY